MVKDVKFLSHSPEHELEWCENSPSIIFASPPQIDLTPIQYNIAHKRKVFDLDDLSEK